MKVLQMSFTFTDTGDFTYILIGLGIFFIGVASHMARKKQLCLELKKELVRVATPLFEQKDRILHPTRKIEDVIDQFAPGDNVQFLAIVFNDLVERGHQSPYFFDLAEIVIKNVC